MKCVICDNEIDKKMHEGKVYWTEGNNAEPVANGRCCDLCDCMLVIPIRMSVVMGPKTTDATAIHLGMHLYRQRMDQYKENNITNEEEE